MAMTAQEVSEYCGARFDRMAELETGRQTASPSDIPGIDEEMDRICLGMAEDLENRASALSGLSQRNRLLAEQSLEELRAMRDKARRHRHVDG